MTRHPSVGQIKCISVRESVSWWGKGRLKKIKYNLKKKKNSTYLLENAGIWRRGWLVARLEGVGQVHLDVLVAPTGKQNWFSRSNLVLHKLPIRKLIICSLDTGCSLNIEFFPKNSRKFATSPSPALGCYWSYKKLPANRKDCTLALRWELLRYLTAM